MLDYMENYLMIKIKNTMIIKMIKNKNMILRISMQELVEKTTWNKNRMNCRIKILNILEKYKDKINKRMRSKNKMVMKLVNWKIGC